LFGLAISLAYLSREEWGLLVVQMKSTCLRGAYRGREDESQHLVVLPWHLNIKEDHILLSLKLTLPSSSSQALLKWLPSFFLLFFLLSVANGGFAYIRKQEKGGKGMFHRQQK
jgi:hypothetical protein